MADKSRISTTRNGGFSRRSRFTRRSAQNACASPPKWRTLRRSVKRMNSRTHCWRPSRTIFALRSRRSKRSLTSSANSGDERSQIIEEQADRLNRLVADLLDLSRLNAGAMPLHVELNAVDDLLSAAVQDTESRVAGRVVTVDLSSDGACSSDGSTSHSRCACSSI